MVDARWDVKNSKKITRKTIAVMALSVPNIRRVNICLY
jgi:hypothetical protein